MPVPDCESLNLFLLRAPADRADCTRLAGGAVALALALLPAAGHALDRRLARPSAGSCANARLVSAAALS